nr:Microtubule-associated protein, microtubule dynamics during spindle orientation [Polyrhizophydium stewartii]
MAEGEEDFSKLALDDRLVHKSWKARQSAYDELAREFRIADPKDTAYFQRFQDNIKGMLSDSNQIALESGVAAVLEFVTVAEMAVRGKSVITPLVVDKCLASTRANTKARALDILLMLVEIDNADLVVECLIAGFAHKTPKNVAACVTALREVISAYGIPLVPFKPIVKALPKIFDHRDNTVRAEGTALALELYRWIGQALMGSLNDLKPVQLKELSALFEQEQGGRPAPKRYRRVDAPKAAAAEAAAAGGGPADAVEQEEPVDDLQFFDPVNVLDKLPKNFYTEISRFVSVVGPLMEKLKEKKNNVLEALRTALDNVFLSVNSIMDLMEEIIAGINHKNPQVKSESMGWLVRCLKHTKKVKKDLTRANSKALAEALIKVRQHSTSLPNALCLADIYDRDAAQAMDDGVDTVRESAAEAIGRMMVILSEQAMLGHLERLDKVKQAKVREHYNNAKGGTAATSSSKAAADEPIKLSFSDESAEEAVVGWLGESLAADIGNSNWKTRLAAIQSISEKIGDQEPPVASEAIVRYLSKKPGWKESNFQVMTGVINIFRNLTKLRSFSKGPASLLIPGCVEKLGDMKVKKVSGECLSGCAETISFEFVLSQAYEPAKKLKSPKAIADVLAWINENLLEFTTVGVKVKVLVDFCKLNLGNSNAAVRTAATNVLVTVFRCVGSDLRGLIQDVTPQLMTTLEAEFEKYANAPRLVATKVQTVVPAATEEILPRVDIMTKIPSSLVEQMCNANWKERKAAIDDLTEAVKATNNKIQPNLGSELVTAIKQRLSDSNKNLASSATELCGLLCTAMGKPFERHVRTFLPGILAQLNDQKTHIRAMVVTTLDKFVEQMTMAPLASSIATSLMADQPQLRKDLLKWLGDRLGADASVGSEMPALVHPTLQCLQDRSQDVRKLAQTVLPLVIRELGAEHVRGQAGDLYRGSALSSLMPMIDSAAAAAGTKPRDAAPAGSKGHDAAVSGSDGAAAAPASKLGGGPMSKLAGAPAKRPLSVPSSALAAATSLDQATFGAEPIAAPTSSASASSSSLSAGPSAADKAYPLVSADPRAKEARAAADRGMHKWTFDAPRRDLIEFLSEQCQACVSAELHTLLFSTDHYKEKDFLAGLKMLDDFAIVALEGQTRDANNVRALFINSSDVILKYLTIRFFDTNTSILLKSLELLEHLFGILDVCGYLMSEYEASSFLPYFIAKAGDPKETLRAKVRGIMKMVSRVYPASRFVTHLIKSLDSKNSRTRSECLEELSSLIQRNGLTAFVPAKTLPMIASQISDRDPASSLGSLNSFETPDARPLSRNGAFGSGRASPLRQQSYSGDEPMPSVVHKEFRLDFEGVMDARPVASASDGTGKGSTGSALQQHTSVERLLPEAERLDLLIDVMITHVTSLDVNQSIDGLKELERLLTAAPEVAGLRVNDMISATALQLRIAFTSLDSQEGSLPRLVKSIANLLIQIFSSDTLSKMVSVNNLEQCMQEVLMRLIDPGLQNMDPTNTLGRTLNILMVRILETCDSNFTFRVLLHILQRSAASCSQLSGDLLALQCKHTELVMKCLWKITKMLPKRLEERSINVADILRDLHDFLQLSPPSYWKKRVAEKIIPQADMPLRTVKTILHELVNALGTDVNKYASDIPQDSSVRTYLDQMLGVTEKRSSRSSRMSRDIEALRRDSRESIGAPSLASSSTATAPTAAAGYGAPSSSGPTSPRDSHRSSFSSATSSTLQRQPSAASMESASTLATSAPAPAAAQAQTAPEQRSSSGLTVEQKRLYYRLEEIFNMISTKEQTKEGVYALYQFQQEHKETVADMIERRLSKTSTYFQGYIRRGLASHAAAAAQEAAQAAAIAASANAAAATSAYGFGYVGADGFQRPPGMGYHDAHGVLGAETASEGSADSFKQTLARLQVMFGNSSSSKDAGDSAARMSPPARTGPSSGIPPQHAGPSAPVVSPTKRSSAMLPGAPSGGSALSGQARPTVSRERIAQVIVAEIDRELLMKRYELSVIRSEIQRSQEILSLLSLLFDEQGYAGVSAQAGSALTRFTQRSSALAAAASIRQLADDANDPSAERAETAQAKATFERRPDGVIVRMECPECMRTQFWDTRSLISHMRRVHDIIVPNRFEAVQRFGTPVRVHGIARAADSPESAQSESEIPHGHVIHEMSKEEWPHRDAQTQMAYKHYTDPSVGTEIKVYEMDLDLDDFSARPDAVPMKVDPYDSMNLDADLPEDESADSDAEMDAPEGTEHSESHGLTATERTFGAQEPLLSELRDDEDIIIDDQDQGPPTVASLPGRYDMQRLFKKVRFFLHPDYRPYDVVDVAKPPFQIERRGWGECPIRLQLHFWDPTTKPINIIHIVKLDESCKNKTASGHSEVAPKVKKLDIGTHELTPEIIQLLEDGCRKFPVIRKETPETALLPYTTASSFKDFMAWSAGKRKAYEFDIEQERPSGILGNTRLAYLPKAHAVDQPWIEAVLSQLHGNKFSPEHGDETRAAVALIAEAVDDDFAVAKGVAYRSLDNHGLRDMERMTESRLAALGWLAGTKQWEFERGEVKFINPLGSLWSAE